MGNFIKKIGETYFAGVTLLVCTSFLLTFLDKPIKVDLVRPLDEIPMIIEDWNGSSSFFDDGTLKNAGMDHYIMRTYVQKDQEPVSVYIGFYSFQEVGHTIHSPWRCYSGSGWEPVSLNRKRIPLQGPHGQTIEVNKMIAQNGRDTQVIYYWFQSRGRNITSEYWDKLYLIWDTVLRRRNDGSLIRFSTGITTCENEAENRLRIFIGKFYPHIMSCLP